MSIVTVVAVALLVSAVAVTAAPRLPGGIALSLAGVYLYWWSSGFGDPSTGTLVVLTLLCLLALSSKVLRPVIVSKVGGTPVLTTTVAGTVGAVLFFFWGTAAFVVGAFLTVFVLEYLRRGDLAGSLVAAVVVLLATFASKAAKVLVAVVVLVVMLVVIFV